MLESSRLTATDLMTRDVVTARPDTKLEVVIRQMLDGGYSGMPMVDADGRAIGMITESDLIRWSEEAEPRTRWWLDMLADGYELAEDFMRAVQDQHARVQAVMSKTVIGVAPDTSARDVAKLLAERGVKRVPVLLDGKPIGIITRRDLVRAMLGTV